jgi:hypothetical protein
MAIVSGVDEVGEHAFYDIPDSDLSKYKLKTAQLTDEVRMRLFPDKDKLTKDDAHGVIPAAPSVGGEVEGYWAVCEYWYVEGGWYYYWYDYC